MDGIVAGFFTGGFEKLKNYVKSSYGGISEYDAEDIVQQTALNMLTRGAGDVDYMSSYVYTALKNGAKNLFRKRSNEVVNDDVESGSTVSAEEEILIAELGQYIRDAIGMLDEKSRFVFMETELAGRSYQELADETGEPIGTLLSRKSRAVKKLQVILKDYVSR